MLKRRTRIVNFRVTDDEFESLKEACSHRGARCLSDYARTTVLDHADAGTPALLTAVAAVGDRVGKLEGKIAAVELAAGRILDLLPVVSGGGHGPDRTVNAHLEEN